MWAHSTVMYLVGNHWGIIDGSPLCLVIETSTVEAVFKRLEHRKRPMQDAISSQEVTPHVGWQDRIALGLLTMRLLHLSIVHRKYETTTI